MPIGEADPKDIRTWTPDGFLGPPDHQSKLLTDE